MKNVTLPMIFETLGAFRRTAALKTAIELDVFSAIGNGMASAAQLAKQCSASERGIRKLCNYLVVLGFIKAIDEGYVLAPGAAAFLDRHSPTWLGAPASEALAGTPLLAAFGALTDAVRKGGTALDGDGTLAPEHPIWVAFARAMGVPGAFFARLLADCLNESAAPPFKILDIAGGHGVYGIEFATRNPQTQVFAVEWPQVLEVARSNAEARGVSGRFHAIPGDALTVEFGSGYDLALITNFLPDLGSTESLLKRVRSALAENGRVALVEMMLNEDRVSPPAAVDLDLALLATTPSGETRTASQLSEALRRAGFRRVEIRDIPPAPGRVAIAHR
jgi:ubiquinone/menaquinone biosynthesis C-methylase UbiE